MMGARHANVLARLCGVDLVGAMSRTPSADEVALIDAAVVAVPTSAHHSVAVQLIRRGVHLLVEKPLAAYLNKHLQPRNGGAYRASIQLTEPATGQP
jgi:predicted dehydrogenase